MNSRSWYCPYDDDDTDAIDIAALIDSVGVVEVGRGESMWMVMEEICGGCSLLVMGLDVD